jgi:hypothetical protein
LDECAGNSSDFELLGCNDAVAQDIAAGWDYRGAAVFSSLRATYDAALRRSATFLSKRRPNAIVVTDDGIASNIILIAAAKVLGVPVLRCPNGNATYRDLENAIALKVASGTAVDVDTPAARMVQQ